MNTEPTLTDHAAYDRAFKRRARMEMRIASMLVRDILAAGHAISVFDGEGFGVGRCRDKRTIMRALASTDEDALFIRDAEGTNLGAVTLVYGNDGWNIISYHTDTPAMNALLAHVIAYADKMQERYR